MNGSCYSDFSGTTEPISQFCFTLLMMTFVYVHLMIIDSCAYLGSQNKHCVLVFKQAIQQYSHIKAETELEQKPSW